AVRCLRNGGVLYELNTAQAASWLRRPEKTASFVQHFGGERTLVKERTFPTVVEYVPISFDPSSDLALRVAEGRSGLDPDSIVRANWIKPVNRRSTTQSFAHAIIRFNSPKAANSAIRDGLVIAGRRVWGRKLLQEPLRCLKCQKLGVAHLASECKQIHDTCGTCGSVSHTTSTCDVTDRAKHWCANCRTGGHAAWDRACPAFLAARDRLLDRQPDAQYRFFPIPSDPSSW
ncbi:hypothetical protein B0H21DRAFT_656965, partial [Amylocystis lapponica]